MRPNTKPRGWFWNQYHICRRSKPVIANTGLVSDPLNLSKLNVSNISCDEGITTDTITCDLTPNLTAGAGVSITSVANKPVISAVNSVSANVPVSDFIETLTIIPSGTTPFVNQGQVKVRNLSAFIITKAVQRTQQQTCSRCMLVIKYTSLGNNQGGFRQPHSNHMSSVI
jgi:hypothetical protein